MPLISPLPRPFHSSALLSTASSLTMESPPGGAGSDRDDQDLTDSQRRKKRYHRHTSRQIQILERTFRECPHPDEKQRQQLSKELGLEPKQIKFWFQNRRTQQKAQHERQDNCTLRSENDKIRCENIAIREALKNVVCPTCVGPSSAAQETSSEDRKLLRIENARLKDELDRVSNLTARYLGKPVSQLPSIEPVPVGALELSMGNYGGQGPTGPSLDLDLLPGASASASTLTFQPPVISEFDKNHMPEVATSAMEELIRLLQAGEPLWIRSPVDGRDVLNIDTYDSMFPRFSQLKNPNLHTEASRCTSVIFMNGATLADMFMDPNKWAELFPTLVLKSSIIDVLSPDMAGSRNGPMLLMYEELQVLTPLVSTREYCFLRNCQQLEQGLWVIADVSFDLSRQNQFPPSLSRKLPSGCLIQDMPNGYSKVTWVEHVEVEEKTQPHRLYRDIVGSGMAFGAERRLATLQRMCERFACLLVKRDPGVGCLGIASLEGKQGLMKLSQRMINVFCASVSASNGQKWSTLTGMNEIGVCVTLQKSPENPGQPNGVVLNAASSIWLPVSPQIVFNFFRDVQSRQQWDVLFSGPVQEIAYIANGSHPGNRISVLRPLNATNNILVLQESCTDATGASLIVHTSMDLSDINVALTGDDPSHIPLLPSGFAILPDGQPDQGGAGASSSSSRGGGGGSLVTVAFQVMVSSLPNAKLNLESVNTVNNLISNTVQRIQAALNCGGGGS